jgi:biotin carboxylase
MTSRIAIVNAYSSANQLPASFAARNVQVVHVQSGGHIPSMMVSTFRPGDFVDNVIHEGDMTVTCARLKQLGVRQVIAGAEYGVELAEALADAYGCPTNSPGTTSRRRHKFDMIEALHAVGVPAAAQKLCRTPDDVQAFMTTCEGMAVVKPVGSGGSDGLHFCKNLEDAMAAFAHLHGKPNAFGQLNREVLIQEYLDGCEYYVNTMSRDGIHRVAELWQTTHISANGIYNLLDSAFILPSEGVLQDTLIQYAFRCLDALGVTDSPAHLEIRMTSRGPRLVELGARLVGGPLSRIARQCIGHSQIELIAQAYADKKEFLRDAGQRYRLQKCVAAVSMIAPRAGLLRSLPRLEELTCLESFQELIQIVKPGNWMPRTENDFTYPLMVILAHQDPAAVTRDSRTMRHIDGESFYDMAE